MQAETAIAWSGIALGMALAMSLVFDRDRLFRWVLVRGLFWGAYVIFNLCVR